MIRRRFHLILIVPGLLILWLLNSGCADYYNTAQVRLNDEDALAAVKRETNQTKLAKIARSHHNDSYVRSAAVAKLTDPDLIATIDREDPNSAVRSAAYYRLKELKDRTLLTKTDPDTKNADILRSATSGANSRQNVETKLADGSTNANISPEALRSLRLSQYRTVRESVDPRACEKFLARYPKGEDSDEVRKVLSSINVGLLCIQMSPKWEVQADPSTLVLGLSTKRYTARITFKAAPNLEEEMSSLQSLLKSGADPSIIHIDGYSKPTEDPLVGTDKQLYVGDTLITVFVPFVHGGDSGHIVRSTEGGITLSEYCERNGLEDAHRLLDAAANK